MDGVHEDGVDDDGDDEETTMMTMIVYPKPSYVRTHYNIEATLNVALCGS